jgi:hypothetical protein
VGLKDTTTLLIICTYTAIVVCILPTNSIIRRIENFKVIEFGTAIVVCIMPTKTYNNLNL